MSARDHYAAIETFLHAQGITDVLDSDVADIPEQGYVVVYLSDPTRTPHRFIRRRQSYRFELMTRSVGLDATQARWISQRVANLTDALLTVPGWDCRRVESIYAGHPVRDADLTSTVTEVVSGFAYDAYRLA